MATQYKRIRIDCNSTKDYHRIIIEENIGRKLKRNEVVHHIDGDKQNNNISNLELLTLEKHSRIHRQNLSAWFGTNTPQKLNKDDLVEIHVLLSFGYTCRYIGILFKIANTTVSKISSGKIWKGSKQSVFSGFEDLL